jgi:hypothetical protein
MQKKPQNSRNVVLLPHDDYSDFSAIAVATGCPNVVGLDNSHILLPVGSSGVSKLVSSAHQLYKFAAVQLAISQTGYQTFL